MNMHQEVNALGAFMKSLRESHSAVSLHLIIDNAKSTSCCEPQVVCPPPPRAASPRSAHKLQRWDGSSLVLVPSPEASSPSSEASVGTDKRKRLDESHSPEREQIQPEITQTRKPLDVSGGKRYPMLEDERTKICSSPPETTSRLPSQRMQLWLRRGPQNVVGGGSPILPVRQSSVRDLLGDAIRCSEQDAPKNVVI